MVHQKRLSAPEHYPVSRKGLTYTTTTKGSRPASEGIPAVIFLREVTGYAETKKEAKEIIRKGQLLRNGDRINDIKDTIGLFDIVELTATEEIFRVLPQKKGLNFVETEDARPATKIKGKTRQGEKFVYHLHNGENYMSSEAYSTESTLIFGDEVEEAEMKEGENVVVLSGQHAGKKATVHEIHKRGMADDTATVETADSEFEIQKEKLFATGGIEVE